MRNKKIKLSRIKISDEMLAAMPNVSTMCEKYSYYKRKHRLASKIVLDERNVLVDGYTSYLIAKMFGIRKVDVVYEK